jgi:hypothetical protein
MAAEKARDPRNEHLHHRPFSGFSAASRIYLFSSERVVLPERYFFFMLTPGQGLPSGLHSFSAAITRDFPNQRAAKKLG